MEYDGAVNLLLLMIKIVGMCQFSHFINDSTESNILPYNGLLFDLT
jgi:hypothetical protein